MTRLTQVSELLRLGPKLHLGPEGHDVSSHLGEEALLFIADRVKPGWSTLEVGVGYSTIAFALAGAAHTAITPSQREVDAISAFSREHGVPMERVHFIVDSSDRAIPGLGADQSFDFILIDGSHAFPMPFIDWHYASPLLRAGGLLMIDDIEVWTGRVLRDFLKAEDGWSLEADLCLGRTAVFRKTADRSATPWWSAQPYVVSRSDLSLLVTRHNPLSLPGVNVPRLARDIAVRAVRTGLSYGHHLLDRDRPPPFRWRRG